MHRALHLACPSYSVAADHSEQARSDSSAASFQPSPYSNLVLTAYITKVCHGSDSTGWTACVLLLAGLLFPGQPGAGKHNWRIVR